MAPRSFTKGKVALLELFFFFFSGVCPEGVTGVMQGASHAWGMWRETEINLEEKERDVGAVTEGDGRRQSETKSNRT